MPILQLLLHLLVTLTVPPFLIGVISRVKAIAAGRRGAPLLQPYFDLYRLFRKGSVFSRTTTWVFRAGPVVGLVTTLLAALFVPFGYPTAPIPFAGDLILFAYLFGLGRYFTVIAAMDTGSSFEGMGAAREATWACLAEPALFLGLLAGVRVSHAISLSGILGQPVLWDRAGAPVALVIVAFFLVLLAENSRIPFDDPNTHLELTMVHEVMVLDHSGPAFGMILYGAAIKLFVFAALLIRLMLPFSATPSLLDWAAFLGGVVGIAVLVGIVESVIPRLQLPKIPRLLVSACLLSAFGLLLVSR